MPTKQDLTGHKYGRLTVIREYKKRNAKRIWWLCICSCNKVVSVTADKLKRGHTKSCGCLKTERIKQFGALMSPSKRTHGLTKTPTYESWRSMLRRCYKTNHVAYHNYGGRGITVCDRWRTSFINFVTDMGLRPEGHSLGRINNDDVYCPDNCVWSNWTEQSHNKRNVKLNIVMVNQIRDLYSRGCNASQLATLFNISPFTVYKIVSYKRWKTQ